MDSTKLQEMFDVYDIRYEPWWHSKYAYLGITGLTIIIAGLLLYFVWKWYVAPQEFSFEQKALLQLQQLHQQSYTSQVSMKDAYFQMTMIMKVYLSKRYKVDLLHKSDMEVIDNIRSVAPSGIFEILQELFGRAYQIKFADAAISTKMLYDDIDCMQTIIYKTIEQKTGSGDF